ncbi:sugar phosphate nucleotidyltransferase [Candidatus Bathyarchaeota archaeon]|nr:sugar phosphate nucleotidyltransferase [Candidatus Bathyarchaeota archaeon]
MPELKAVILAAGEGIRLRPLTDNRPKQLIPIAGTPILEHQIRSLAACGISEILLIVGTKKDSIQNYFGEGRSFGVRLSYTVQPAVLGTAHAIGMARDFVHDEKFLVLYGDIYVRDDAFKRVLESFEVDGSVASMTVVPVSAPQFFGIAKIEQGYVKSLVEKPSSMPSVGNLANAGVFVFPPRIFEAIGKTSKSERGEFEITQSLNLLIEGGVQVRAVELEPGTWKDIGRPWDLLEANEIALRNIESSVQGEVEDGAHFSGPVLMEKGAFIRSGSYIEGPVCISAEAEIGPNCYIRPFTSSGKNVRIGNGCEIKNSIVMNDTKIPHLSYVGDSVIGERCNLGAGTVIANLRFDEEPVKMMISGSLVSSGRRKLGAILGDDVQTGINVSIMPGVKIGSSSFIAPSMTVARDVSPNSRVV